MSSVYVTNNNDFDHADRYDGEDFLFPKGERVLVPVEAATHMLGYNLVDKTDTLVRLGWATKYDPVTKTFAEDKEGVRKLASFVFEEAVMTPRSLVKAAQPDLA